MRLPNWRRRPPVSVIGRELNPEGGKQLKAIIGVLNEKIMLLAIVAGGISPWTARHRRREFYLDLGGDGPRRYRDYDGPRYRDYDGRRYREREQYGDRGERGYYRRTARDFGRLTGARTAGRCKTVSANRTGATEWNSHSTRMSQITKTVAAEYRWGRGINRSNSEISGLTVELMRRRPGLRCRRHLPDPRRGRLESLSRVARCSPSPDEFSFPDLGMTTSSSWCRISR